MGGLPFRVTHIASSNASRSQLANGSLYISSVYSGSPELTGSYQCLATVDNVGSIVSRSAIIKLASAY